MSYEDLQRWVDLKFRDVSIYFIYNRSVFYKKGQM